MSPSDEERFWQILSDENVPDPIGMWRHEMREKRLDQQNQARERALNSTYRLSRVERVPAFTPNGDPAGYQDVIAELITTTVGSMPELAHERGLDVAELKAVSEARLEETRSRGGDRFRLYPLRSFNHGPSQEDLEDMEADRKLDAEFRAKQQVREANKQAARPRVPILTSFGWSDKRK